ncbi:hypothetical protein [Enhygromyxa salina]|uniref:Uncharacterized protein n=1 Tax=Enhygromyxa salina TaxID=215803 RepID=A0A2S9YM61_9BACT|nr:hypothetical protein [Enhygromyxa salina]PRQ06183.1 hypothetical protein ENSA7_41010 [Enhygromyxa salina]
MPNSKVLLKNIRKVLDEIELVRADADRKQLNFTAVDEGMLVRKYARAHAPMIIFQAWNSEASPGGAVSYTFGVHNPDSVEATWLYGYAYVGPANFVTSVGEAVSARDRRFANLSAPRFPGQQIDPLSTVHLKFSMPIPRNIEKSTYQGNTMLFQADWHDVGQYLDRGFWSFDVA